MNCEGLWGWLRRCPALGTFVLIGVAVWCCLLDSKWLIGTYNDYPPAVGNVGVAVQW